MSQGQLINELLGLQDWEVLEEDVLVSESEVVVPVVRSEHSRFVCSGCGQAYLFAYDYMPVRQVRDFPVWGRPCWLAFNAARVACEHCGVRVERLDWIEPRSRQTLRYERYVATLCELMPALDVAELEGLDKNTVYRLDKKWLERRWAQREQKPVRHLGIDEIAIRKGHKYATLFYDLERREVVGAVKTREQRAVNRFFRRWGKAACAHITAVCADLWKAYHNSVKRYLKNAVMVFDKFHVFSYLSQAIDQVRRDEQNRALTEQGYRLIKGSRWLWLKNRDNLKPQHKQSLDEIIAVNHNLHKAYLLKEDFEGFYACETRQQAEEFLEQWTQRCKASALAPYKALARRLNRWKHGILAFFDHPITNAVSEGINNKAKVLKRRSYGFHDFEYFILKIIGATGGLPPLNATEATHTF